MNTSKHTPGPWVTEESDGNLAKVVVVKDGLRSVIARLHENSLCNEHDGSVNANAHLIAAAPAMYEALQMAMLALEELAQHPAFEGEAEEFNAGGYGYIALSKTQAALAQAEGE